jgi:hypothetical protein
LLFLVGSLGTLIVALRGGASATLTVWTIDVRDAVQDAGDWGWRSGQSRISCGGLILLASLLSRHLLPGSQAPFTAGAVFFLFGAWVTTRMWKAEQFGLAFMNEINDFAPAAPNSTMPVRLHAGFAPGDPASFQPASSPAHSHAPPLHVPRRRIGYKGFRPLCT